MNCHPISIFFKQNLLQLLLHHLIALKCYVYIQNFPIFQADECNIFSPQHLWYAVSVYLQEKTMKFAIVFIVVNINETRIKTYAKLDDRVFDCSPHELLEN